MVGLCYVPFVGTRTGAKGLVLYIPIICSLRFVSSLSEIGFMLNSVREETNGGGIRATNGGEEI